MPQEKTKAKAIRSAERSLEILAVEEAAGFQI